MLESATYQLQLRLVDTAENRVAVHAYIFLVPIGRPRPIGIHFLVPIGQARPIGMVVKI